VKGKTHDIASSRHGRHRPPGTICRGPAGRCRPRRACSRPPPARHPAAGHVLHRRSSAGRGDRPRRAWRRGDHPLRDQHEGRRRGDKEPGGGGGQSRLPALRAAVHRRHRRHGGMGIREDEAQGRAHRGEQRPAVDDPAGHAVLQLLLREFPEASEVSAGGTGASGLSCPAGRLPRGRGPPRRARAWRARRPGTRHVGPGSIELEGPVP
jgi:hypothetical protein